MAKQEELRALIDALAIATDNYGHLRAVAKAEGREYCEKVGKQYDVYKVAKNRIFSFFGQMRQTIDGLSADVERRAHVNKLLATERDEAVRQVTGLLKQCAAFEHQLSVLNATNEKLRKDAAPVAEDTFVPFDLARKDGLEVLVGVPGVGKWLPATYIGHTPSGLHVVEAAGHGIVAITDVVVGLRHRVKAKTVTLWANLRRNEQGVVFGDLSTTEEHAKLISGGYRDEVTVKAFATVPVTVTVAE